MHEKAVQTVKSILEKCKESEQDPYLALLDYRNTPINGVSPAQALMSRKLRSNIPTRSALLAPKEINHKEFIIKRTEEQQKQKAYYDRGAKPLKPLNQGDTVRVQLDPNKTVWKPATIVAEHNAPRSYILRTSDGTEYERNRRHIIKSQEVMPTPEGPQDSEPQQPSELESTNENTEPTVPDITPPVIQRRSGRIIKPVQRYGFNT